MLPEAVAGWIPTSELIQTVDSDAKDTTELRSVKTFLPRYIDEAYTEV